MSATRFSCEPARSFALEALPAAAAALFAQDVAAGFFATREWFALSLAFGVGVGAEGRFLVAETRGRPLLMLPVLRERNVLRGLTTPYTCLFAPLVAPEAAAEEIRRAGHALGLVLRSWPSVRLDAMAAEGDWRAPFDEGLGTAGLRVRSYDHFGNWHEKVDDQSWETYLAARPGALRTTIARRLRQWQREAGTRFALFEGGAELEEGIAAFEEVYRRSWKEAEPFPKMNAATMRAAAGLGALRLGLLFLGATPVAAQIWIVEGPRATVLKLAHDEAYARFSPGTVLTASMIRLLLEGGGIAELDFGRGDDAYKAQWARSRRQRIGLLIANPRRPAGFAALARHSLGRMRRP